MQINQDLFRQLLNTVMQNLSHDICAIEENGTVDRIQADGTFSRIAAILNSKGGGGRLSADSLRFLRLGQLAVLIEDHLVSGKADDPQRCRNDSIVLMRSLLSLLLNLGESGIDDDAMRQPLRAYLYGMTDGAGCFAALLYRQLTDAALLSPLGVNEDMPLGTVFRTAQRALYGSESDRGHSVRLVMDLLIWPMTFYEKNINHMTAATVRLFLERLTEKLYNIGVGGDDRA